MRPAACVDASFGRTVRALKGLIRQPSVSATGEGIGECAPLVRDALRGAGMRATVLRAGRAAPAVYAEARSSANPGRALLFYNHYDVQPPDPLGEWRDPPFSGAERGGRVYGRGASDDKGELMARAAAVAAELDSTGDVPCTVRFLVEGEEEVGSPNLGLHLRRHRRRLACDGVVWEFGYVDGAHRPVVSLGMKGLLYVELSARGPRRDAHSSLAALIESPAWRLVGALRTLRGPGGRVAVRGWHAGARPLTAAERRLVRAEPLDERALMRRHGVRGLVGGARGYAARRALAAGATCNIAGLSSGYAGPGAKTVLPAAASAKLDFRLVPGMDPAAQAAMLRRHLAARGFGDVRVRVLSSVAAARTDPADPLVACVRAAAADSHGGSALSASSAGTGPMHAVSSALGAPCVAVGCTHVGAGIHSPNEHVRKDLLRRAAKCMCGVMERFGALTGGSAGPSGRRAPATPSPGRQL